MNLKIKKQIKKTPTITTTCRSMSDQLIGKKLELENKQKKIGKRERINTKHTTHTHASDDVIRKTKNSFEEFDFFFWWGEIQFTKYVINCFFKKKTIDF